MFPLKYVKLRVPNKFKILLRAFLNFIFFKDFTYFSDARFIVFSEILDPNFLFTCDKVKSPLIFVDVLSETVSAETFLSLGAPETVNLGS